MAWHAGPVLSASSPDARAKRTLVASAGLHPHTLQTLKTLAHGYGMDEQPTDEIYRAFAATNGPTNASLLVRTAADPGSFARRIPVAVHDVDPRQPVSRIRTLESIRSTSLAPGTAVSRPATNPPVTDSARARVRPRERSSASGVASTSGDGRRRTSLRGPFLRDDGAEEAFEA